MYRYANTLIHVYIFARLLRLQILKKTGKTVRIKASNSEIIVEYTNELYATINRF
jgi:hypothetical protein